MVELTSAVNFDNYARVKNAYYRLDEKVNLLQTYPCQWPWFKKYLPLNRLKFPVLEIIMKLLTHVSKLAKIYPTSKSSRIPADIREQIVTVAKKMYNLGDLLYLDSDINEIERISSRHFHGYQPEFIPNIYRLIYDVSIKGILINATGHPDFQRNSPISRITKILDENTKRLKALRTESPDNHLTENAIRSDFDELLKIIAGIEGTLDLYGQLHDSLSMAMANAHPISLAPLLSHVINMDPYIDQIINTEIGFVPTEQVKNALRSLWRKNTALQSALFEIMEFLQKVFKNLKHSKNNYLERNYDVIVLSFKGIKFVNEKIWYRMNFPFQRNYNDLKRRLSRLANSSDSDILAVLKSKRLDLSQLYIDEDNNCVEIAKEIHQTCSQFNGYVNKAVKTNTKEVVDDAMKKTNNWYMTALFKLVKIEQVVIRKSAPFIRH